MARVTIFVARAQARPKKQARPGSKKSGSTQPNKHGVHCACSQLINAAIDLLTNAMQSLSEKKRNKLTGLFQSSYVNITIYI